MPLRHAFAATLLLAAFHSHLQAASGTLVQDSIIDPLAHNFATPSFSVATVHGVTFQQDGVTTYKGWQYATYYQGNPANSTGKVAVARRPLPRGEWQTLVLNDYTFSTNDSHNDVVLGICPGDDSIHLSFDHHGNDLNYRMSVPRAAGDPVNTAWTSALFGPVTDRLLAGGAVMGAVTYPRFIPTPGGKLLFTYRFGGSGGGDEILYEYDGTTRAWSLVGQYTTRAGSYTGSFASGADRNGYFDNTLFDSNGRLHATWCWRETPNAASNHDLLYAYSDDTGRTWKNQLGSTIAVTGSDYISVNSTGITGWSVPQSRNYINNSAMTVDKQGRVHVVAWHLPDGFPDQAFSTSLASNSRFIHYWRGIDGVWRKNESNLTGSRAKLSADDDGRLFLIYGNASNIQIAAANPASNPELDPTNSWNDWSPLTLSAALPAGRANTVNIITDTARWEADRIISVYAQETNTSGTAPTPLHILDYHVSRAAVLPVPLDGSVEPAPPGHLSWTAGQDSVMHDVYFGTSAAAVAAAKPSAPEYLGRQATTTRAPGPLTSGTTYYWRVDSIDAADALTPGRIWSFNTASLLPTVTQGPAARSYGGRATFPVTLNLKDPALSTGDLTLYYGASDGGTDTASWQKSFAFGPRSAGNHVLTLDAVANTTLHYRFHINTVHGAAWAEGSGILAPSEDLPLWSRSALLDVTGYTGTDTLTDFPVLIRLSPANLPGFTYDQMLSPPHGDLRFSTPGGEQILAHEVETWNPSSTSHVWVKLSELSPGTKLRIWWGKSGQSPPPPAPTWSAFNGVWHLDEALGFATDSSAKNISAAATNLTPASPGIIPGTAALSGSASAVVIDNTVSLNPAHISVEAWVKTTSGTGTPAIFNKDQSNGGSNRVWQFRLNAGKPEFIVFNATNNAAATSPDAVNDDQFHHLCGSWDGTTIRIHVDGILKGSTAFSGTLRSNQSNKAFIGRGENATPNYLAGSVDEVRLSPVARSSDWIRATWHNQQPAARFFTVTSPTIPDLDADRLPDAWEMLHFGSTFSTHPDPDSDGHDNLLEFAFGTDPNSGAVQPVLAIVPAGGANPHEIIYQQLAGGSGAIGTTYTAAGLRYTVELSPDLNTWHSGPSFVAWSNRREPASAGMERVGVHITNPTLNSATQIFARIRIHPAE